VNVAPAGRPIDRESGFLLTGGSTIHPPSSRGGTSEKIFSFSRLISFIVGHPPVFQQKRWITALSAVPLMTLGRSNVRSARNIGLALAIIESCPVFFFGGPRPCRWRRCQPVHHAQAATTRAVREFSLSQKQGSLSVYQASVASRDMLSCEANAARKCCAQMVAYDRLLFWIYAE
jgi:hypothetical protein